MTNADPVHVPEDRRVRSPLITGEAYAFLKGILEHPDAPRWNYEVGDRVVQEDLRAVAMLRRSLAGPRSPGTGAPPASILRWVRRMRPKVPSFRSRVPERFDLRSRWAEVPTTWREDLVLRLPDMVPDGADLSRLIVYDTSGATGHAIRVPHHPRTIAQNHAYLEYVLARHGIRSDFRPGETACINVGAQASTVVFATTFSVWNQAGFVKVNLHPGSWNPVSARRFFAALSPRILTGDPVGFAEMIAWGIRVKPAALVSTAVLLEPALEKRLQKYFGCPVIDTYAMTETGPIAYANPEHDGLCVLPEDIHVEIVDGEGRPVPEGERGEICVTGGRNPYLPLLRYRTGDFARMAWSRTVASDPAPRILELRARLPVRFRAADGSPVSPVDIGRILRQWSFVQHEFVQSGDGSCAVALQPIPGCPVDTKEMAERLRRLFGRGIRVTVRLDPDLGREAKVIPFRQGPPTGLPPSPARRFRAILREGENMTKGMIHRLLDVFMDAAKGMGIRCDCSEMERLAVMVHRVMSYQSRQFHTLEHVFSFLPGADHETALAAAFHDLVYYQVDDGLPPDLENIVGRYLRRRDGSGIRLAEPGQDAAYGDTLAVFGFAPGQTLPPYSGLNEFLSALVMTKSLERHLTRTARIAIEACIEASIPFRGPDAEGRGVGEVLEARLGTLLGGVGVEEMVHRAIAFANRDIKDFTLPDPGLFLSNTWKLLPESNAPLRGKGAFRIREYRVALGKMLGFFRSLQPDRICHSYRGTPDETGMGRLEKACRRNLELAQAYLQAKLLAVGLLEAASEVSGGDAPMALFMGDLPQCDDDGECLTTFLPDAPVPQWIERDDPVHHLLKDGRLEESGFDLKNSPLALHLRHRLPPAAWKAGLHSSEEYFAGRVSAERHLMGFEPGLRADFLGACGRMVPTRKDVLTSWLKEHSGT